MIILNLHVNSLLTTRRLLTTEYSIPWVLSKIKFCSGAWLLPHITRNKSKTYRWNVTCLLSSSEWVSAQGNWKHKLCYFWLFRMNVSVISSRLLQPQTHKAATVHLTRGRKIILPAKVLLWNVLQITIITGRHRQMPCAVKRRTPDGRVAVRLQEGLTSELTSDI